MKIDFLKLGNYLRWGTSVLFTTLAILGSIGIMKGNYLHIITMAGFLIMAYAVAKKW